MRWFGPRDEESPERRNLKFQSRFSRGHTNDEHIQLEDAVVVASLPFACFLLTLASTAFAQAAISDAGGRCSNHTLNGSYGFLLEGTDLASGLPFRGVVMQTYDGKGGIRQVDHVVFAGSPPPLEWTPGTGTYSVNPDCTGAAVLHTVQGDIPVHFVVADNGKQIKQVVGANAVTAVGNRVN